MRSGFIRILLVSILLLQGTVLHAKQTPKGLFTDQRIKIVNYDPDNVVHIHTTFGYATTIELQKGEFITESPAIGKGAGWEVASLPYSNVLIVKPKVENNTTNLNFTSNRGRTYTLLLTASESASNSTFRVRFMYNDQQLSLLGTNRQTDNLIHHFGNTENINQQYSFAGDKWIAPIAARDNGTFTLLRFQKGAPIPAILAVDPKTRREALVNYRMQNGYVVLDGVKTQYTLRYGSHVTCVFNDRLLKASQEPDGFGGMK